MTIQLLIATLKIGHEKLGIGRPSIRHTSRHHGPITLLLRRNELSFGSVKELLRALEVFGDVFEILALERLEHNKIGFAEIYRPVVLFDPFHLNDVLFARLQLLV